MLHHSPTAPAWRYRITIIRLSHAGAATDIQLQFGPAGAAERDHQNRVVEETAADGILLADRLSSLLDILVPLRDSRHREEIVEFVSVFDADNLFLLELYHAAADRQAVGSAEEMLRTVEEMLRTVEEMLRTVEETLLARGFSGADIEITVEVTREARATVAARAREHNVVVMGETEKSVTEGRLFGPVCTTRTEESETPIIVVKG